MRFRWQERYVRARESFWFLPAVLVVLAVVLSQLTLLLDRRIDLDWAGNSQLALGVDGSRGLLTTIGGSVLAVAGTAFSITISVIATASSSYGPRLVRNFMKDRGNQLVLGVFVATFAYCIIVLRSVTAADSDAGRQAFVPYISVYLALLIALVNIGCLVYFIHHIADSIQISTLVRAVRGDLTRVAGKEYPATDEAWDDDAVPAVRLDPHDEDVEVVTVGANGYLNGVDTSSLLTLARERGLTIEMVPRVGDHVIAEEQLARVRCSSDPDDPEDTAQSDRTELADRIRSNVTVGAARSPHQDIRFALQQVAEVAVRAMSSGVNDSYTAQNAIEELGSGMAAIARGLEPPEGIADRNGDLRLVLRRPRPIELIDLVFDDLRIHGTGDPRIMRAAIQLAKRVAEAGSADLGQRVWLHIDLMISAFADSGAAEFDVSRMRELATASVEDLRLRPYPPEPGG
ncbi:MAG: DUF2254 domain-containing protein [Actinomycetia bacterium]|nr:DUF2254 domain-containing protein [Actinomycetes bacterium]